LGKGYWGRTIPWSFLDLPEKQRPSYQERRKMRYRLQDYMHGAIGFDRWAGKRVLEVGCGAGIDSAEFAAHGATVDAVDSSPLAVKLTKHTVEEAGMSEKVRVQLMGSAHLEFDPGTFDLVYCFGVLHHLRNPERAVAEAARVLRRNGEYVVMLYHKDSLLFAYSIQHLGLEFERVPRVPRAKAYTIPEAKQLLGTAFRRAEVTPYYNVIDLPSQRKIKLNIENGFGLGWHLICKARK
jgi:2-polyprenyl-3-methyl-5-hydroxy-6-metoxy-1,4-benzoquinol methylase